ncbi:hypothetical protein [Persicobacter sp. CCB-QB2]|uniref:hypothetical protein n=1 Tax=Persicobacter sp. CCB-QB2 TaxID=1561025 RepID=UPI0006A99CC2|nr:hypothetical protein [Persicobacter sp. CCB-QB2]
MRLKYIFYIAFFLLVSCKQEELFYPQSPDCQYTFFIDEEDYSWVNQVAYAVIQSEGSDKILAQKLLAHPTDTSVVVPYSKGLIGPSELFKVELMSEHGMVVAAIPMDSAKLAPYVRDPLPYGIVRSFNQQYSEVLEVVLANGFTEADFGYAGWGISIVERTDFTITASLIDDKGVWIPVSGTIRIENEEGAILVEQKGLDSGFSKIGVPKGTMTTIFFTPDDQNLKVEKARLVLDQGQYLNLDYPIERIHDQNDIIDIIFSKIN